VRFSVRRHPENGLKKVAKMYRNGRRFILHMLEIPSQMNDAVSGGAQILK
jgi:hypothetical protein